jgi:hypothetical protein
VLTDLEVRNAKSVSTHLVTTKRCHLSVLEKARSPELRRKIRIRTKQNTLWMLKRQMQMRGTGSAGDWTDAGNRTPASNGVALARPRPTRHYAAGRGCLHDPIPSPTKDSKSAEPEI